MTWELVLVIVVAMICATGLVAWRWWLIHLAEPVDEQE